MNTNKNHVKDYTTAKEYLSGKANRPFAHNTRIKADSMGHDRITITYHDNPIVAFYPDRISFTSCGWHTSTTKERLNWFMPEGWRLYQERGVWYVWNYQTNKKHTFADGITFYNGEWQNYAPDDEVRKIQARTKQIKKYVSGYVKAFLAGKVESPSGGDCWYCMMHTESGESLGDSFNDIDHFESHFEESYYVPSLLINAIGFYPVCLMTQDGIGRAWNGESLDKWQQEIVQRDITSSLTRYLKHEFGIAA